METSERKLKESRKKARLRRVDELKDLKWVLSSKAGRKFLWRMLERAGLHSSSFHHHNGVMSFNEGKRSIGNELLVDINEADIEAYFQMQRENREDNGPDQADTESGSEFDPIAGVDSEL